MNHQGLRTFASINHNLSKLIMTSILQLFNDLWDNLGQAWSLTILSSLLCILGCFVIFIDDLYNWIFPSRFTRDHPFKLNENLSFLIASLSFSSGCLIFTSLYRLLPKGYAYFEDSGLKGHLNAYLVGSFVFGLALCLSLNGILHMITSESVVHCSHDLEGGHHDHEHGHNHDDNDHSKVADHEHQEQEIIHVDENTPLMPQIKKKFSLIHLFRKEDVGECKGYSSAEICVNDVKKLHYCELPVSLKGDNDNDNHSVHSLYSREVHSPHHEHEQADHDNHLEHHHSHGHSHHQIDNHSHYQNEGAKSTHSDHHHHISTPISRLLMIGIQTTLAITLHKLPEGFITFVTSEADSRLGLEIFLSLLVHNFIEGFSMCLPLYYSFSNSPNSKYAKLKSILIGGGLGGISQPLGGVLGMSFLKVSHYNIKDLNFVFGIIMSITSGFLTVVALTMFGSAIGFNRGPNFVVVWTLVGMSVIGGSLILND
ncbi:zinc-regulated transporter 3 [[Candida] jaroonii]|uniref:Zinc-regulated transporter 3 n=1 Tax=[Candida] jaroonii TaxID=467808 RepID=A0ACA9Y0Q3_9ASCO|nr:zinc-regulated transporter 3 [[Candida] jaroonii]